MCHFYLDGSVDNLKWTDIKTTQTGTPKFLRNHYERQHMIFKSVDNLTMEKASYYFQTF